MFDEARPHEFSLEPEAWLAAIIENSDDVILSKTLDGVITSWNPAAERMFGYSAREAIGQSITIIIPQDRLHEEREILAKIRVGERVDHFRTTRQRRDGSLVDVSVTVSAVRDSAGMVQGASKIIRDITEHQLAEKRQTLLMLEMNHRIKNLFAVVAGLVKVSARSATSKADLATALTGRITALAHSHALTLPDPGQPIATTALTTLSGLLHAILAPYPGQYTIELDGAEVFVSSKYLSSLALMLHEWATNAAKYGALSAQDGRLTLRISSDGTLFRLVWIETSGPPPTLANTIEGFGAELERASLRGLDGTVEREWRPEGLVIMLAVPIRKTA